MALKKKRSTDWLSFLVGAGIVGSLAAFFSSGYTPPGVCGEVIRHNQKADIDASPFFYGDVDNMMEIIEEAEQLHCEAVSRQKSEKNDP